MYVKAYSFQICQACTLLTSGSHSHMKLQKLVADCRAEKDKEKSMLEDECIVSIAGRLTKSPAQVILRWLYQRRVVSIPKSVTRARIQQNLQVHFLFCSCVMLCDVMILY